MGKKLDGIKIGREIAEGHGGELLSTAYVNNYTKMSWRCTEGHEWFASLSNIKVGKWCRKCSIVKSGQRRVLVDGLEQAQRHASKNSGKCLSEEYVSAITKMRWRCSDEHEWEASLHAIKQGNWCCKCGNISSGKKKMLKDGLEQAQTIALAARGECLSNEYHGVSMKMRWLCHNNHEWKARLSDIKRGKWCPKCASNVKGIAKRIPGLDIANDIAVKHGGKCLSSEYISVKMHMLWRCKEGHEWPACLEHIRNGKWCPKCGDIRSGNRRKLKDGLEQAKSIAKGRGGECTSTKYTNSHTKMDWTCEYGHSWNATLSTVKLSGHWCPHCVNRYMDGLGQANDIATSRNGWCLSTSYKTSSDPMKWKCSFGHIWSTTLSGVKSGKWCPKCGYKSTAQKQSLDGIKEAHDLASENNGKCLSKSYENTKTSLKWNCKCGNIWHAGFGSIKYSKSWCPKCSYKKAAISRNDSCMMSHWKTGEELVVTASYEKAVVKYLNENKINYDWQPQTFKMPSGRTYRPDMYLYSIGKWVEIKGHFWGRSREKWDWFQTVKPNSELWNTEKLKQMGII